MTEGPATIPDPDAEQFVSSVNYALWFWRIISWDALLPAAMILAPFAIRWVVPNRQGFMEIAAVTLPILAFFLRVSAGKRQIAHNRCSMKVRRIQFGVFCVGIFPLVLFDCFMMLGALAGNGRPDDDTIKALAVMIGIYLSAMTLAMYPGRASGPPQIQSEPVPTARTA
jgi:hypothetical protein